jgi:hypothetical protein
MNNITAYLHNGELKHEWDGHFYNQHVLEYDRNESINPNSEMIELEVYCMMCEEQHSKRIHTDEEWRVDALYTYLCGQFADSCPTPRDEIAKAAKEAWREYEGEVFTNEVRMDMKDQILAVVDDNTVQVTFE